MIAPTPNADKGLAELAAIVRQSHVAGMREAAQIARTLFCVESCICDPDRINTSGPLPGCVFHEAQEIADEIEAQADFIALGEQEPKP